MSFVVIAGRAAATEDLAEVRPRAAVISGCYPGQGPAEAYGERNGVPGELLVRVTPTKITDVLDIVD